MQGVTEAAPARAAIKVLYLAYDVFAYGGIQRYTRYELQALAEIYGRDAIRVCSLMPPGESVLGDPPAVDVVGSGDAAIDKLKFGRQVVQTTGSAELIICDHVNLSPIGRRVARRSGAALCVNVYGIEVWGPLLTWRRRGLLAADRIVSDCAFTQRLLLERLPKLTGRISVVRDCVDTERFEAAGESTALRSSLALDGRPVVLTVSRLERGRSKGHEVVMQALVQMQRSGRPFTYLVAGDGADRSRLEGVAHELGVAEHVRFLGRVDDDELPELYRLCDVFVLASGFRLGRNAAGEGVPLVVLEAQASGRPAITSRLDGSAESIVDGETGYLVDPHDATEIKDALERLLSDDALRERMGVAARRLAVERFSFEVFREHLANALTAVTHR